MVLNAHLGVEVEHLHVDQNGDLEDEESAEDHACTDFLFAAEDVDEGLDGVDHVENEHKVERQFEVAIDTLTILHLNHQDSPNGTQHTHQDSQQIEN